MHHYEKYCKIRPGVTLLLFSVFVCVGEGFRNLYNRRTTVLQDLLSFLLAFSSAVAAMLFLKNLVLPTAHTHKFEHRPTERR